MMDIDEKIIRGLPQHKYHPFGPYLAEMPVDPDYCARLLKLGKKLKKSYQKHLAGQIEHEYLYSLETEPWIVQEFQIYINTWIEGYRRFNTQVNFNPNYQLIQMWMNRMKAKEYNPSHIHTECALSFVLWLEVPQQMLNEKNETNGPNPGDISFHFGEVAGGLAVTGKQFSPQVNTLMMFPGFLRHEVRHFNSEVTRTSVAGNIG